MALRRRTGLDVYRGHPPPAEVEMGIPENGNRLSRVSLFDGAREKLEIFAVLIDLRQFMKLV